MYNENSYLNYNDLNVIENKIYEMTNILKEYDININFNKKNWVLNEFPYIQEIDRIEKAIDNLGKNYYYPSSFIESKIWLETGTDLKNFSYKDINRWINNLNSIENVIEDGSTIWNSSKSEINWNEQSNEEWM